MTTRDLGDRLALELEHQPQHAVGRRVLRAHVDDDALFGRLLGAAAEDLVPVAAGDGVDAALGGLGDARVAAEAVVRIGVLTSSSCARRAAGSRRPCTRRGRRRAGSPCAAGGPSQSSGIMIRVSPWWPS